MMSMFYLLVSIDQDVYVHLHMYLFSRKIYFEKKIDGADMLGNIMTGKVVD